MKKVFVTLILTLIAGLTASCATIMRDNAQPIPIKANVD